MHGIRHVRASPVAMAAVLVAVVLASAVWSQRTAAGTPQEPDVALVMPEHAQAGQPLTVRVVARHVRDLAGFQGSIRFDQNNLRMADFTSSALSATGREIIQLGPVVRDGVVTFGVATCPVSRCASRQPATTPQVARGLENDVELGTISFVAVNPGQFDLALTEVRLIDTNGQSRLASAAHARFDVAPQ